MTTKAQVNVVMSDKALVKHLQKELARLESELRTPVPVSAAPDYAALLRKKDLQIEKVGLRRVSPQILFLLPLVVFFSLYSRVKIFLYV